MATTKERMLEQVDRVIAAGAALTFTSFQDDLRRTRLSVNSGKLGEWKFLAIATVAAIVPPDHPLANEFKSLSRVQANTVAYCIGAFKGLRQAIEDGLLDSITAAVRDAVTADDLSLAEEVLSDHAGPDRSHIAAAVIAGATLERAARARCGALGIDRKASGEPKTLNALIDALKGAAVITALRDKQMRPWVDIRNAAAHGDFDKFNRQDVEAFLRDLPAVLTEIR